jgi:ABC-2 type transport system ATP-binding protein
VTDALRFDDVAYRYGRRTAVDGLTFRVPSGVFAGFVGHNGAGKTTAFSLVSGFLRPSRGAIDVLGHGPFEPLAMKGLLGVLPQDAELPRSAHPRRGAGPPRAPAGACPPPPPAPRPTASWTWSTSPIARGRRSPRCRTACADGWPSRPRCWARRRSCCSTSRCPGSIPRSSTTSARALSRLRGRQTLLVSSHDLPDLERLADWVVLLRQGRCVEQGPLGAVTLAGSVARWELGPGAEGALAALREAVPGHVFGVVGDAIVEEAPPGGDLDASSVAVMRALTAAGVPLRGVRRGVGLERRFLQDLTPK